MHQHANIPVRRLPVGHLSTRPTRETAEVSVDHPSLERAAAEVLPSWVYSYVGYGAGDGHTQQANIKAFSRLGSSLACSWCDRTRPIGITVRHAAAQPTGACASRQRTRSRPTAKTSTPSQRSSAVATQVTRYRSREPPMPSMYATIAAKPNGCARQQRPLRISHPCCDWATGQ